MGTVFYSITAAFSVRMEWSLEWDGAGGVHGRYP